MGGYPRDVGVELHHAIADLGDLHKPARHSPVDQRIVAAPAVRIAVIVGVEPHQFACTTKGADDFLVGVEHLHALEVGHLTGEFSSRVHRVADRDAGSVGHQLVLLTKGRGDMHHARAVLGGDVVGLQHLVGVGGTGEVGEQRLVVAAHQRRALHAVHLHGVGQFFGVTAQTRFRQDVALRRAIRLWFLHHRIIDVRPHRQSQIGGQRPRCGGPRQHLLAGAIRELKHHGHRRILALFVDVIHTRFGIGQWRFASPAVRQHLETFVDETLVPQRPERPHHALHVREVQRLVVVGEVHPAGLAGYIALPVLGVGQHAGATGVVESSDTQFQDLRLAGDAQLLLGGDLGRQSVTVPPEATLHPPATHGLIPRDRILHITSQ